MRRTTDRNCVLDCAAIHKASLRAAQGCDAIDSFGLSKANASAHAYIGRAELIGVAVSPYRPAPASMSCAPGSELPCHDMFDLESKGHIVVAEYV